MKTGKQFCWLGFGCNLVNLNWENIDYLSAIKKFKQ